jgi:cellulose biosynthesis protein BcsQ
VLLPGDPRTFVAAEPLSTALQNRVVDIGRLRSFRQMVLAAAAAGRLDIVLVDLSPSADIISQNILLLSDFWILPSNHDNYSMLTYKNLGIGSDRGVRRIARTSNTKSPCSSSRC